MLFLIFIQLILICLLGFMAVFPSKPHTNIILENTLPQDKLHHPKVKAVVKQYRTGLIKITLFFTLISLPLFLCPYDSIIFTAFMLIIFGDIAVLYFHSIHYIHKLHHLQVQENWILPTEAVLVDTDVTLHKNKKMLSFNWLLGSLFVTVLANILAFRLTDLAGNQWIITGITLTIWLLLLILYLYVRRFPVKAWSKKSDLNQQYNDLTKATWSLIIIVLSFTFAPISLIPTSLMIYSSLIKNVLVALYLCLLLVVCCWTCFLLLKLRKQQDQLVEHEREQRYVGDDQYWKYGFYYNPNDNRLMLPDRVGFNVTINMAKPAAKIIMSLFGLLLAAALIAPPILLFQYDFGENAIQLQVNKTDVTFSAPLAKKDTIDLTSIQQIQLIDQLPNGLVRSNGFASTNYAIGSYASNGRKASLYVRLDQHRILFIQTADQDYYFTGRSEKETKANYQQILQQLI